MLDAERLTNYPRIFIALYVVIGGWWVMSGPGLLDRGGTPIGGDFVTFYAAAELLREAPAEALYDLARLHAVEERVIGAEIERLAWHYPPPAMLAAWPLALAPFLAALALWTAASLAAYVRVVRAIDPHPIALGLALAFPGLFQNVMHGQNGCFSLALLAGALMLEKRPWLAGALLGLLLYKPHLLPLAGVALLASGQWRGLAAMTGVALGLVAVSWPLGAWPAFVENLDFAWAVLSQGGVDISKVPTTAGAALLVGAPPFVAQLAQAAVSLLAVTGVAYAFWKKTPLRVGALGAGALLATPFAFEYDLVILALPLLLIGAQRRAEDTPLLVIGWLTPLALTGLAHLVPVQLTPALLLWVLWRCARG